MSKPLRVLLNEEEGRVAHAYEDHLGFLTIGVGHLIDKKKGGRLPEHIIDALLDYDIAEATKQAEQLEGFARLNEVQQAAIISMIFQLGYRGVRGFPKMLDALAKGNVRLAAKHGRDSKWRREDTPRRAERQMRMLESGLWVPFNIH